MEDEGEGRAEVEESGEVEVEDEEEEEEEEWEVKAGTLIPPGLLPLVISLVVLLLKLLL